MQAVWVKDLYESMNVTVTFQIKISPQSNTKIKLAASNLYRLFVNGEMIGYGPARAAHGYTRADEYSLAKWAGTEAVLSAEVCSYHINTFYTLDEAPFFAAEITEGDTMVATAADFTAYPMTERVQKVRRFSFQRAFTEVYRLTGDPKAFHSGHTAGHKAAETVEVPMHALLDRGVSYPTLSFTPVAGTVEYGAVGYDPEAEIWHDRCYEGVDNEKIKGFTPEEIEEDCGNEAATFTYRRTGEDTLSSFDADTYQIYDLGRSFTGFFSLTAKVAENSVLYVIFDETVTDKEGYREVAPFRNGCCNVIKYTLPAGEHHLLSYEANTARYATVVVTKGSVQVSDFGMVLYENPDAASFSYDYADDELNRITAAAVNTFAQNAVDIFMDCPSRERAGWLCDGYFTARAEALFTGKNLVEKNFLENYALCHQSPYLPEGMIPMCYPADHNDGLFIPNWSMWYILQLRNYVERTGDEAMREASRDKVMGLLHYFEHFTNEFGLLEILDGWIFVEWSMCNNFYYTYGVNYPTNMLWASTLEAIDDLYDMPHLREKAAAMRKEIRRLSYNGEFFEENSFRNDQGELYLLGHTTETCQYYAFYFDVATPEEYPELYEKVVNEFGPKRDFPAVYPDVHQSNAFIGNYLRLELLLRWGMKDRVLQDCRDFFLKMADSTGTLWEHATLGASLNHGFASMAGVYIHECMKD